MEAINRMDRREFVRKAALATGGMSLGGSLLAGQPEHQQKVNNPIPAWKGFNVQDFFSPDPADPFGRKQPGPSGRWTRTGW